MAPSEVLCDEDGEVEEISRVRLSIWRSSGVHFTHTLFTQYQITLRGAALRNASFRFCANRLGMRDTSGLSGINSSDGIPFTLIGPYVDENNVHRIPFLKATCQDYARIFQQVCHVQRRRSSG